jgi:hypothetical protein
MINEKTFQKAPKYAIQGIECPYCGWSFEMEIVNSNKDLTSYTKSELERHIKVSHKEIYDKNNTRN